MAGTIISHALIDIISAQKKKNQRLELVYNGGDWGDKWSSAPFCGPLTTKFCRTKLTWIQTFLFDLYIFVFFGFFFVNACCHNDFWLERLVSGNSERVTSSSCGTWMLGDSRSSSDAVCKAGMFFVAFVFSLVCEIDMLSEVNCCWSK